MDVSTAKKNLYDASRAEWLRSTHFLERIDAAVRVDLAWKSPFDLTKFIGTITDTTDREVVKALVAYIDAENAAYVNPYLSVEGAKW